MPRYYPHLLKTLLNTDEHHLRAKVQFLKAENEILRSRLPKQIRTTPAERARLIRLSKPLGSTIIELITVVSPRTFTRWMSSGGAKGKRIARKKTGRRQVPEPIQRLVLRIAEETGAGYTKIRGELKKLGIRISRKTIKNILKRNGMTPDPHRGEGKWDQFLKMHIQTLWACDFICANVWALKGLRQYWMVLFIHLGSRRIFCHSLQRAS